MDESRGLSEGARVAGFSVLIQLGVGVFEVAFAFLGGSVALLADGVDSISDAGISLLVWLGLKFAQKPPTRRFPYGYFKVESFAALILAFVMMGTASYILSQGMIWIRTRLDVEPARPTFDILGPVSALPWCAVTLS